ncbi:UNVERIFIED_CONTAM: hypothetical protein IGO34_24485, partial [Salmonella enterica subsp. enterica serovar Weltevreden]
SGPEGYSDSEQRYAIRLPQEGEVFFITLLQGKTVLARHKAHVIAD